MIVSEIVCALSNLYSYSVELFVRLIVYSDCRWNCVRV